MNRRHLLQGLSVSLLSPKLPQELLAGVDSHVTAPGVPPARKMTFLFGNGSRNLDEFHAFARMASRMKPYGDVQVDIGTLADKSWYETPSVVNSPWHEYANEGTCIAKFFPHPKIAPFIPADWVAKNRELLLVKAAILRELGLNAAFHSDETHFLPAAFFEKYPHLRGPRIDHPRRSNQPEFSWCVDLEETREMIEWMACELKRSVPEIKTIMSHINDAGGGLCWAAALYSGPNGPAHCANRNAGTRVKEYVAAIHRGAQKAGGDVVFRIDGLFWQNEDELIARMLPLNSLLESGGPPPEANGEDAYDRSTTGVGSLINEANPVKGLIDPLAMLSSLESATSPAVNTIVINTSPWYLRGDDSLQTAAKLVEIVQDFLDRPVRGLIPRLDRLRELAVRWGGNQNADSLVEAFYAMNQAFLLKEAIAPMYSATYCDVSMRFITRPLLFNPEVLTAEEERYFLPYVFNVSVKDARDDYADFHGGKMTGPATWDDAGLQRAVANALSAAQKMESAKGAPEEKWLKQLALSLKLWMCGVRSINNFYFGQLIRDRNKDVIAKGPRRPTKQYYLMGDNDYEDWNAIQRDELDNTNELIGILQNGGMDLIVRADSPRYEDTFLLGPDLIGALRQKTRLMQREWLDVQQYLSSPMK